MATKSDDIAILTVTYILDDSLWGWRNIEPAALESVRCRAIADFVKNEDPLAVVADGSWSVQFVSKRGNQ